MKKILSIILMVFCVASVFGQGFTFHNNSTSTIRVSWTVTVTRYDSTGAAVSWPSANAVDYVLYAGQTGGGWTEDHYYTGGSAHESATGTYTETVGGTDSGIVSAVWYPSGFLTQIYELNHTAPPPPPPPTTTNITQCIQNLSSHFVDATAKVDGSIIALRTLYPGQVWCITTSLNVDGSSGVFDMGYTLNPLETWDNSDNPFATNGMNTDFSITNGFTVSSNGFVPINPPSGQTNVTLGGGGATTNTITVGSGGFSTTIWTNNINYSGTGTAGDAKDSTLRAGFGTLHNDNAFILNAVKVLHTDLGELKVLDTDLNGLMTLATVMTNELGQVIAAIYHQTNNDQMPVFINSVTNNATANETALSFAITNNATANRIASTAAITNAIRSEEASITNNLNDLGNTMGGISNLFSQLTDMTNADIGTETTQLGMSNLLSAIRNNMTNGSQNVSNLSQSSPTNRATESTLAKLYDWLHEGWTNRLEVPDHTETNTVAGDNGIGYMQAVIDSLSTPPDLGGDPGHTSIWEMNFCGRTIDLDPVDMFPGVCAFSVGLWDFVLVAMYLLALGKVDYEIAKALTSVQTGTVPDVSVAGTNAVIGVVAGGLVTVALMLLFQALVTAIIVPLGEFLGLYQAISTVFLAAKSTPQGQAGVHVLFALFPVQLAIRLFTSYLTLYFSLSIQVTIFSRAARFLLIK